MNKVLIIFLPLLILIISGCSEIPGHIISVAYNSCKDKDGVSTLQTGAPGPSLRITCMNGEIFYVKR